VGRKDQTLARNVSDWGRGNTSGSRIEGEKVLQDVLGRTRHGKMGTGKKKGTKERGRHQVQFSENLLGKCKGGQSNA